MNTGRDGGKTGLPIDKKYNIEVFKFKMFPMLRCGFP
jgi:hypothetical protein